MSDLDVALLRDPARFAQGIVTRGTEWADKDAAAAMLEETRKSVLANEINRHADLPFGRAEALALASDAYKEHVAAMVEARRLANRAKVVYDGAKALMELARSAEATRRTEMGLR